MPKNSTKKLSLALVLGGFLFTFQLSAEQPAAAKIKKSNARVCYEESSAKYDSIKNFTIYDSIEACVKSGGHLEAGSVAATPTPSAEKTSKHKEKPRLPQQL